MGREASQQTHRGHGEGRAGRGGRAVHDELRAFGQDVRALGDLQSW